MWPRKYRRGRQSRVAEGEPTELGDRKLRGKENLRHQQRPPLTFLLSCGGYAGADDSRELLGRATARKGAEGPMTLACLRLMRATAREFLFLWTYHQSG